MAVVLQEGLVPFDIGVPISGDVAIGLWFGAYNLGQRLHSRPAAAYAFHTAFFEENKVTYSLLVSLTMHCAASWTTSRIDIIPHPFCLGQWWSLTFLLVSAVLQVASMPLKL